MTEVINKAETRGRKPLFGQKMTDTERNRRSQRRKRILSEVAEEHGMRPISGFMPAEVINELEKFLGEGERFDSLLWEICVQWLEERHEDSEGAVGVPRDPDRQPPPVEAVMRAAEHRARAEGL